MGKLDAPFIDTFHEKLDDAIKEAHLRKGGSEAAIVSVEESPYGGWRVRSIPAEFAVDLMTDSLSMGSGFARRVYG